MYDAHQPSPLIYGASIAVQAVLFLAAAAALSLFYLSYRPADFSRTLVMIGLLLTAPWFLLSLLPAFFGLEDNELRREMMVRQVLTVGAVVVVLLGLSTLLGFHHELWHQMVSMARTAGAYFRHSLEAIGSCAAASIDTLTVLFNDKVRPLFSG